MSSSAFARLIHADWSKSPDKRWMAEAVRTGNIWTADAPRLVGSVSDFVANLIEGPQPALAGFDFPIGVPSSFGQMTEFENFVEAIEAFGVGQWSRFYDVAERAEDISVYRPFYPRVSNSSARQVHLLDALGVKHMTDLLRLCERATDDRPAACSLFWTLGGKQVGKAAISGWREVVQPARRAGALLWPFEGTLSDLAGANRLVICETYPAEAYRHVDVHFRLGGSKRRQDDRRDASATLIGRSEQHGIRLTKAMNETIANGFGPGEGGEDPFDAAIGLLGMIEVVENRRVAVPNQVPTLAWEGWILGQSAVPTLIASTVAGRSDAPRNSESEEHENKAANKVEFLSMADADEIRAQFLTVSTATLTTALFKRGFRNVFVEGARPLNPATCRMAGPAFTLRYIPAREDLDTIEVFKDPRHPQRHAVETIPPGAVMVVDSRGDAHAASAGGILITRMMVRGAAGFVTDGGLRDSPEIGRMPFPAFCRAPSAPTNLIRHHAIDIDVPIGCGGVAVYPGDWVVGDGEGVVIVPREIAAEIAAEAVEMTAFEDWVERQVAAGRSIIGLYPPNPETRAEYEAFLAKAKPDREG